MLILEADNEMDGSNVGDKTTNIYKQTPVLNAYYLISEIVDILKSGYYESPLGYDNVNWFVNEVIKLENKMTFWFKKTNNDIIMTQEDKEDFEKKDICRFCEKEILSDKVCDHCHLTGKYRVPSHNTCNINVKQKGSIFISTVFQNYSNYDSHMFFRRLVDLKKDKVKLKIIPKTYEEYISVTYDCISWLYNFWLYNKLFLDNYRFLSKSLDELVKKVDEDEFKILRKEYPDKWHYLIKKLVYPYQNFNSIDDYKKPVDNLKKRRLLQ